MSLANEREHSYPKKRVPEGRADVDGNGITAFELSAAASSIPLDSFSRVSSARDSKRDRNGVGVAAQASVLRAICDRWPNSWSSALDISKRARVSKRHAFRALHQLEESGWLTRHGGNIRKPDGRFETVQFVVNAKKIIEAADKATLRSLLGKRASVMTQGHAPNDSASCWPSDAASSKPIIHKPVIKPDSVDPFEDSDLVSESAPAPNSLSFKPVNCADDAASFGEKYGNPNCPTCGEETDFWGDSDIWRCLKCEKTWRGYASLREEREEKNDEVPF